MRTIRFVKRVRFGLPFLFAVALLSCGGRVPSIILHNGSVLTLEETNAQEEAVAIRDDTIVAVGRDPGVMALAGEGTRVIDLRGRTVMPALKDHHVHLFNVGLAVLNRQRKEQLFLDLSTAHSLDEIANRVAERAAAQPKGSWILGTGWSQIAWGTQELPTHHPLTKAAPDNPVFLVRVDGHGAWVNLQALRAAGIGRQTADPHGGRILRFEDGSPSGILLERAVEPVLGKIPEPPDEVIIKAFRAGARALAAQGITEIYDAGFLAFPGVVAMTARLERYYELLRRLDAAEPLPLRVNLMVPAPTTFGLDVLRNPRQYRPSARLGVTHIKLFADGALGSRGAALSRPYADDPSTQGVLRMTGDEMREEVRQALDAGLDVATHAIGDAAVARVVQVYGSVLQANPSVAPRRLRIEHFSVASPPDMRRAARLGVLLCIQPGFVWPGDDGLTMEDSRLGSDNSAGAYAWATLARMGAVMIGSSDDFTAPGPPLWNFYAAVTRENPAGRPPNGWHPDERLSRDAAIRLFTDLVQPGGEYARGQLREGAPADLVILSGNPLAVPELEICSIRVNATIRDGQVAYSDGLIR
jgi:predicted amidohydrolase YtcJ